MINVIYEDSPTSDQLMREYAEAVDIIPALHKYQSEHSLENLQKLCVEVLEFCEAIYASTRSDEERSVYKRVFAKIKK
jgi:hypothetical protein